MLARLFIRRSLSALAAALVLLPCALVQVQAQVPPQRAVTARFRGLLVPGLIVPALFALMAWENAAATPDERLAQERPSRPAQLELIRPRTELLRVPVLIAQRCRGNRFGAADSNQCIDCAAGQQPLGAACVNCSPDSFNPPGGSGSPRCLSCPATHVPDAQGARCISCGPNEVPDARGVNCVSCGSGRSLASDAPGTCVSCPPGLINPGRDAQCRPCPGNTLPNVERSACLNCPAGHFPGQNACHACPADAVNPAGLSGGSDCRTCAAPLVPNSQRSDCVQP